MTKHVGFVYTYAKKAKNRKINDENVVTSQYDFILTFDADIHIFAIFFMDTIACACEG